MQLVQQRAISALDVIRQQRLGGVLQPQARAGKGA